MYWKGELYELHALAHLALDELYELHELHMFFRLELHELAHLALDELSAIAHPSRTCADELPSRSSSRENMCSSCSSRSSPVSYRRKELARATVS